MSYKPLENVTIVFSTANITVCADEWGDLYYTTEIPDEFVNQGEPYAEEHRPTSATAQQAVRLATMYRYGLGCDADHETAVHWYTVAAERGSIYAQQRLEVMEMQRIRQEQRAAEYAEKQQQQQNLSFAARLLNTIGNALCRQTLRDQQSATATTDRKQRRMQRRLKRALGQKEDYEQIFQ